MASRNCPATRIRLAHNLSMKGIAVLQQSTHVWPTVFENQYVPQPDVSPNDERQLVSSFGNSAFFDFAADSNFAAGIRVRLAQTHTYGYIKIPDSPIHNVYMTTPGAAYNSNSTSVPALLDIYWDYDTNYSSGFTFTVNSGNLGGYFLGISDISNANITQQSLFQVNGHGPDGTSQSYYWDDAFVTATDEVVTIPWADINAVDDIYVYFVEPTSTTTAAPPPTTTSTTTVASITWVAYGGITTQPSCTGTYGYRNRSLVKTSGGSSSVPEVGDTLYTNTLQNTLASANTWWIDAGGTKAKIGSNGIVSQIINC